MAEEELSQLITRLHDSFAGEFSSPEQQRLMKDIEAHMHDADQPEQPKPNLLETLELLLDDVADTHPHIAGTIKEALRHLGNMGI